MIYLTGHGGSEFLKFQDNEEISSFDLAAALQQMHSKRRYNEIMVVADTCQAFSLFERINVPGVVVTGSSKEGQNSYSHHTDLHLGVAVIDRFTYYNLETLEKLGLDSRDTLGELVSSNPSDARFARCLFCKTKPLFAIFFCHSVVLASLLVYNVRPETHTFRTRLAIKPLSTTRSGIGNGLFRRRDKY